MQAPDAKTRSVPVIGMIVPPAAGDVPPEPRALYPQGVRFAARGLALQNMSVADFSEAVERVVTLARALRDEEQASAISLMGTSLSFFGGGTYHDMLVQRLIEGTGLPATTMSHSICDALNLLGARRLAVGTAYTDEINQRLAVFLQAQGFEVASMIGMGVSSIDTVLGIGEDAVTTLGRRAAQAATHGADALLVSCGGLPALHLAGALETEIGMPVVASSTAGAWGAMRLVGHSGAAPALGRLGDVSARKAGQPAPAAADSRHPAGV
ncbi:MAG: hypothetical protein JJU19_10745 [Pararhodobacter sp.]|nr:hypothetical protein [Pararhodobacter sp.]